MICVSISNVSLERAIQYAQQYPFVEFRFDSLSFDIPDIPRLVGSARKTIATCRSCAHSDRFSILKHSLEAGAEFVDVELESEPMFVEEMAYITRLLNRKLIVSYHNYEETPSLFVLKRIYASAVTVGADLVKIACHTNSMQDNAKLLSLLAECHNLIVVGMGTIGRLTRIISPLLGSPFTFAAPDDGPPSAPGQLTFTQMTELMDEIGSLSNDRS